MRESMKVKEATPENIASLAGHRMHTDESKSCVTQGVYAMLDSLPTTISQETIYALSMLLQHPEVCEGIEHGHEAFVDEYCGSDESWTVDELTALVDESSLVSSHMDKTIVDGYILDKLTDGQGLRRIHIDWAEVAENRERLGQDMFYYGLGFLL